MELIRFTITIFLGGASISLAIFSFISSLRNNKQSKEALDKIKDLTYEIKSNLNMSISNQRGYTDKMLDTIISKSSYESQINNKLTGNLDEDTVNELVELKVNQIEKNLHSIIESKINNLEKDTSKEVFALINQLGKSLTNEEIRKGTEQNQEDLPIYIKKILIKYKKIPALLLLISVIVKEKPDIKNFEDYVKKYSLPNGWKEALKQLEIEGVIVQQDEQITIPISHKLGLEKWVQENWNRVLQLSAVYRIKGNDKAETREEELEIGSKFEI